MTNRRQVVLDRFLSGSIALLAAAAIGAAYLAFHPIQTQRSGPGDAAKAASPAPASRRVSSESDLAAVWGRLDKNDATGRQQAEQAAAASRADREAEARDGSALPFKVRGIIYSPTAALCAVFIEVNGKVGRYESGEKVGDWTVETVAMDSIVLSRNGEHKEIYVESGPSGPHPSSRTASAGRQPEIGTIAVTIPPSADPAGRKIVHSAPDGSDAAPGPRRKLVTTSVAAAAPPAGAKNCDARVSVAGQDVDLVRDDPAQALQGVTYALPTDEHGGMNGVVLTSVPIGSMAARYSLAPGDRILAVNGQPINSLSRAIELYNQYRDSSSVQVQIERNGHPMNVLFYVN